MDDSLGTLVGTIASGIVVGLPAFALVTLIQSLRKKRFAGWGFSITGAIAVIGASGLVLTVASESTPAGTAGILLFPFLLSVLVVNGGLARKESGAAPPPRNATQSAKPEQFRSQGNHQTRDANATGHIKKSGKRPIGLFIRKTTVVLFIILYDGLLIMGGYANYHNRFPDPVGEIPDVAPERAYDASGDLITNFESTIRVQNNGAMVVSETITARVTTNGNDIQNGIRRTLADNLSPVINTDAPISHFFNQDRRHVEYNVQNMAVYRIESGERNETLHDDNTPSEHVVDGDNETTICFWCEGPSLEPGLYRYRMVYRTQAPLNTNDQGDVLFWHVTGREGWSVPIERVETNIVLPTGVTVDTARAWKQRTQQVVKSVPIKALNTDDGTNELAATIPNGLTPDGSVSIALELPHGQIAQRSTSGAVSIWRMIFLGFVMIVMTSIGLIFVIFR